MRISDWSSDVCSSDLAPESMSRLPRSRLAPSRRLLTVALLGLCCTPAMAAETGATPALDEPPQDLDRVTVLGLRYLPEYNARKTRSATKTDTELPDVPPAVPVVTDKLIAVQAMTSLVDPTRSNPGLGHIRRE